ncbi:MAG: hypothetical protein HZA15_15290 [Nitrospirae bacterium]|nr:hypothetical protein [Nitrospirota bacterium]
MREMKGDIGWRWAAETSQIDRMIKWLRDIPSLLQKWIIVWSAGLFTGNIQGVTALFHLPVPTRFRRIMFAVRTL